MNKTIYNHQARISVLELLVIELLAAQPNAKKIIAAFIKEAAGQQARQATLDMPQEFRDAFRSQLAQLLQDLQLRRP